MVAVLPHILDTGTGGGPPVPPCLLSALGARSGSIGAADPLSSSLKFCVSIRSCRPKLLPGSPSEVGRQVQKENVGVSYWAQCL